MCGVGVSIEHEHDVAVVVHADLDVNTPRAKGTLGPLSVITFDNMPEPLGFLEVDHLRESTQVSSAAVADDPASLHAMDAVSCGAVLRTLPNSSKKLRVQVVDPLRQAGISEIRVIELAFGYDGSHVAEKNLYLDRRVKFFSSWPETAPLLSSHSW